MNCYCSTDICLDVCFHGKCFFVCSPSWWSSGCEASVCIHADRSVIGHSNRPSCPSIPAAACWRGPWVVRVPDPLIAGNNLYPPFPPLTSSSSKNKRRCCSTHGWPLRQIIALASGTTANQLPQDNASVRPGCHVSILTSRQSRWTQGQQLFARDEHLWCRCQCHALKIQRVKVYRLRGYWEGEVVVCQFRQSAEDRWTRLVAVRMRSTEVSLTFSGFLSASSSSPLMWPLLQRSVNLTRSSLWCHLPSLSLSTNC